MTTFEIIILVLVLMMALPFLIVSVNIVLYAILAIMVGVLNFIEYIKELISKRPERKKCDDDMLNKKNI